MLVYVILNCKLLLEFYDTYLRLSIKASFTIMCSAKLKLKMLAGKSGQSNLRMEDCSIGQSAAV